MDANQLRRAWNAFWAERGHVLVPSAGLVPHHPTAPMFTNAGMNQFVPIFLGEEAAPYPRAASIQKCVRAGGKHNDIDEIGRTARHVTFFEMMGNFSFGDYFKAEAIPWAWQLVTEVYGLDPGRLWVTVYETDDEAAEIWADATPVGAERIQRLGKKDNYWEMGDTGPSGPCSEIFYDQGEGFGPGGGPAGGGEERYVEFWNLVFIQDNRRADGSLTPLGKRHIDTGAGLERNLVVLNGLMSVWDTDVLRPLIDTAQSVTGRQYGGSASHEPVDVSLRIIADHARTVTFLVNDGVLPSNEERGYVLRRLLRRAVRHAYQLGVERPVTPTMVAAVIDVMADAYPDLRRNADFITGIVSREEEQFLRTLAAGSARIEAELAATPTAGPGPGARTETQTGAPVETDTARISGEVAFLLHDTFGFPIDLTKEIAAERGVTVDLEGFDAAMAGQRQQAADAARAKRASGQSAIDVEQYREIIDTFGPTEFTGYAEFTSRGHVLAVLDAGDGQVEIFLDRTPFYAEGGGQVGDTGTIETETGAARVLDTTAALPGLHRHTAEVTSGGIEAGQEATASIDGPRRQAIRRNHTATHLLHWALRDLLGPQVKQQSSYVGPDYLRFDFNHHAPLTPAEIRQIEDLVNDRILADEPVRAFETTKAEAEALGAIAFFGDKYGDIVRVIEAGSRSTELCGGTHVSSLGTIGPFKILSEKSIGSNLRRVEATTGTGTIAVVRHEEDVLERAAELLRASPDDLVEAVEKALARVRAAEDELKALRRASAGDRAAELAATAEDGVVVGRVDGFDPQALKDLAVKVRDHAGIRAVVLASSPDGERAALVAAVTPGSGLVAHELIAEAARTVGGGGGKQADVATAGGKFPDRIDDALGQVRAALGQVAPAT
jgi:alanyl-tRNA synthetase